MKFKPFNSVAEGLLYVLLLLALVFNIVNARINSENARKAKDIAASNQRFAEEVNRQTMAARAQNIDRQKEIQDYIKCVVLLKYYEPPLTATSTKAETVAALDTCAKTT